MQLCASFDALSLISRLNKTLHCNFWYCELVLVFHFFYHNFLP